MSLATDKDSLFEIDKKTLEKILKKVSGRLQVELGKEINKLAMNNGRVINNATNINFVIDMAERLTPILEEAGLNELLKTYSDSTLKIYSQLKSKVLEGNGIEVMLNQTSNDYFKAILRSNLQQLKGLSTATLDKIRETFIESALFEMTDKQLTARILGTVEKNFKQYSETYIETSRGLFIQQAIDKNYEEIKDNGDVDAYIYEYVGVHDDKVRVICAIGLSKRFFTEAEKIEFESKYGTRYNCRHSFVLIPIDRAREEGYKG